MIEVPRLTLIPTERILEYAIQILRSAHNPGQYSHFQLRKVHIFLLMPASFLLMKVF